jgi:exodeoxyribonuclease III
VRIATFNINNINKRLDNLLAWLAKAEPEVASLQELKAEQGAFPVDALRSHGYEAVWQGERSSNGVAILARPRSRADLRKLTALEGVELHVQIQKPSSRERLGVRVVRKRNPI